MMRTMIEGYDDDSDGAEQTRRRRRRRRWRRRKRRRRRRRRRRTRRNDFSPAKIIGRARTGTAVITQRGRCGLYGTAANPSRAPAQRQVLPARYGTTAACAALGDNVRRATRVVHWPTSSSSPLSLLLLLLLSSSSSSSSSLSSSSSSLSSSSLPPDHHNFSFFLLSIFFPRSPVGSVQPARSRARAHACVAHPGPPATPFPGSRRPPRPAALPTRRQSRAHRKRKRRT